MVVLHRLDNLTRNSPTGRRLLLGFREGAFEASATRQHRPLSVAATYREYPVYQPSLGTAEALGSWGECCQY